MLIRPAVPDDALPVARVHVRSWQVAYRGLLPDDYLAQLRPEDRASTYDFSHLDPAKPYTQVAVEEDAIVGFATTMPARDCDLGHCGELCALYADPEHWSLGVGMALIAAARKHLVEGGFGQALLWVLDGNVRAERFYRRDGWTPDDTRRSATVWGVDVEESRFVRELTR